MSAVPAPTASRWHLALALGFIVCLLAGSPVRVVGDGGEYLVQALNFAAGEGPAISAGHMPGLIESALPVVPSLADESSAPPVVADQRGRMDFLHFWFYALLGSPFVWVAGTLGANPLTGFVVLNVLLIMGALALALPRIGTAAAVLLFASPVVWWLDKAHTEVFTFSLLTIAMLTLRDRPWWTFIALGGAATQNPPIAVLLAPALLLQVPRGRAWLFDARVVGGLAAGLALALLHPAYSLDRYGVLSPLLAAANDGVPSPAEWLAFVIDPNIGLVPNAPVFVLAAVTAAVLVAMLPRAGERDGHGYADLALVAGAAVLFLFAFARTGNFHHGATPSISRYALWLLPLAVPLFMRLHRAERPGWQWFAPRAALVSACISVVAFHPAVGQNDREPTWLASWLWTAHPSWSSPLPEVFAEVLMKTERPELPVATPNCEKILLAGRGDVGVWPIPCYPAPMPEDCRPRGHSCYANLSADEPYVFVRTPGRRAADGLIARQRVWPLDTEAGVRAIFEEMGWRDLVPNGPGADNLRAIHDVGAWVLARSDRMLVVLRQPQEGAVLRFRTPEPVTGRLIEPRTGAVILELSGVGGSDDMWEVPIPADHETLILTLRRTPAA